MRRATSQSAVCYVVAGENASYHESRSTECAVAYSNLFLGEAKTLIGTVGLEEKWHDFHDESLGKAVKDDEAYIIYNVTLAEEISKHATQLAHGFLEARLLVGLFLCICQAGT